VPRALASVASTIPSLSVVHQSGEGREGDVERRYTELGLRADVRPFLDDVSGELERADLVIARSGAGTVAEVAAVGRSAIFVPFPFAADDHQRSNAEALVTAGGAVCVVERDASAARLAEEIGRILGDAALRSAMAEASRSAGRPHAARDVAGDLMRIAGISPRRRENGTASVEAI
jgi:UDP-N-acetylglucosamine--N-acetylmuramyl-(pentapeptide) pyrophosphoryl-undecaprenol N-acetylglucosamine transferase